MKILITGATGFIGQHLVKHLHNQHQVTVLSRLPTKAYHLLGNDIDVIDDLALLDDLNPFDAVINLAGEPIAEKRWTAEQKHKICQSRWIMTQQLSQLIANSQQPPSCLINASAIGYYGQNSEDSIDESYQPNTSDFAHTVCKRWEELAQQAQSEHTRVCILRIGIVLGKEGGALQKMLPAFRFGLGGPFGKGQQYMSWIHISDMIKAIIFLLENQECQGVYNATAPQVVTNREFTRTLAQCLKRPHFAKVPSWVLKLMLGEASSLVLEGQKVQPKHLLDEGFKFCYPELKRTLELLVKPD